jgi:ribosomal-protein-alanine N-acetyltransferase
VLLHTPRLTLRRFQRSDAAPMLPLIGDFAIADTTARIPHPYTQEDADAFLSMLEANPSKPIACITFTATGQLIGAVGLEPDTHNNRAELGYWIGRPFWNQGYATEAARAMLAHAFTALSFNKVNAHHVTRNPASGRVLEKIGMRREGLLTAHTRRWDKYEDCIAYGLTRAEFLARQPNQGAHHGPHAAAQALG